MDKANMKAVLQKYTYHVGQAAEYKHTGKCGDKGRNPHKCDPVALPCADQRSGAMR